MIVRKVAVKVITNPDEKGFKRTIFAGGPELTSTKVDLKKGTPAPQHKHPHAQVNYIHSGSLEVTIAGEKSVLNAGDSFYVEPNVEHGAFALEDTVMFEVFTPQRDDLVK